MQAKRYHTKLILIKFMQLTLPPKSVHVNINISKQAMVFAKTLGMGHHWLKLPRTKTNYSQETIKVKKI